ncbi:MAG TPA: FkbM family methyltransferase [Burkholderiales bacterium]|nr:FkbM family methyltransferase [Burkholderiales bacterium]
MTRIGTYLYEGAAWHFSQEGEDVILQRLFEGASAGFYVDVGAHHPRRFSNTYVFYQKGWHGINIEPNPKAMALFLKERPRDINVQAGVSDQPGTLTYIEFDEPALNTFDAGLAVTRERSTRYKIVNRRQVTVFRLSDLLDRYLERGRQIDFMSIDAEGFDLQVIRSNDWTRYRPTYLLIENLGSSLESLPGQPIHEFLSEKGYRLHAKTMNTCIYGDGAGETGS